MIQNKIIYFQFSKGEFKKISKRYSEDLQEMIDKMIVLDPQKRVGTEFVLKKCEEVIT